MVFCSNCGVKLNDGVKFCSNCGTAVVLPVDLTSTNSIENARKLRLEAIGKINTGDLNGALVLLMQAIEINPDYLDAYENLGVVHMRKGDYQKAFNAFHQEISLFPECSSAYWSCGLVYAKMQDFDNTILNCTQAISIAEKHPELYGNNDPHRIAMYYNTRGVAYGNKNDIVHALLDYAKAFSLNPDRQDYKENMEEAKKRMGIK
jgi:tetratricopeptide (TPR) repeat protein